MKRYIHLVGLLLAVSVLCSSCLNSGDEDSVEYSNDTAIIAFSLGTLNRHLTTTSSKGTDSTYVSTYAGSKYVFTIDQYQQKIFNTDSLPYGTDAAHVLASISSKNNGTIVIKSLNSDTLTYYINTDSIDFSQPRELRVYAMDGSGYRAYQVTVNVHQVPDNAMRWIKRQAADMPVDAVAALWEPRVAEAGLARFVGAGTVHGYAFNEEGRLMVSGDEGLTWTEDAIDDDAALLPATLSAFVSYPFIVNDSTDYQLLVGSSERSAYSVVWRKVDEYAQNSATSQWAYIPATSNNTSLLPKMTRLSMAYYKGKVLAVGDDGKIYISLDNGVTWRTNAAYTLPTEVGTDNVRLFNANDGSLWLEQTDTGVVWQGLLTE